MNEKRTKHKGDEEKCAGCEDWVFEREEEERGIMVILHLSNFIKDKVVISCGFC